MRCLLNLFLCILLSLPGVAQQYHPVKVDGKWGLITSDGDVFLDPVYDAVGMFENNYALVQKGEKVGLISRQGIEVVPPEWDEVAVLDSGLFSVFDHERWKMTDAKGAILLDMDPDLLERRKGNFIGVLKNGFWGAAQYDGQLIIAPEFDDLSKFDEHYYLLEKGNKKGLASLKGEMIIAPESFEIKIHNDRLFFFRKKHDWAAVDIQGNEQIKPEWRAFSFFNNNFIRLVDSAAVVALYSYAASGIIGRGQYDGFLPFSNSYCLTRKNGMFGLIDSTGTEVLPPLYDEIQLYGDLIFRVQTNDLWGVVGSGGTAIIPLEFDYVGPLRSNVAVVKKGDKFGVINDAGQIVADLKYNKIRLEDNVAHAYEGEIFELLVFDETGQLTDQDHYENFGTIRIGYRAERARRVGVASNSRSDFVMENFEWFFHSRSGKWGLRDLNSGRVVMPPTYDHVLVKKDLGFSIVALESKNQQTFDRTTFDFRFVYGIIDNTRGLPITEVNLWDVRLEDLEIKDLPVARCVFAGGRQGLISRKGAVVAENFTFIGEFENGLARMSKKGRLTVKMYEGEEHLGKLFKYLSDLKTFYARESMTKYDIELESDGKLQCDGCEWGFVDTLLQVAVPPTYDFVHNFVNGVSIVKENGKWGTIGTAGEVLLESEFNRIHFIENSGNRMLRVFVNKEQYGIIDSSGNFAVHVGYDKVEPFSEGMAAVKKGYRWGFVNSEGVEVVPCQFEKVLPFSSGLAGVRFNRKWGYIDKRGNLVIEHVFRRVGDFKEGLAWASKSGKTGYINDKGKMVIEPQYTQCFPFQNGVAVVRISGAYGLITKTGQFLLKPKMEKIEPFNAYGVAIYQQGGGFGIINQHGEKLTRIKFQNIEPFSEGMAVVRYKGKYGFIDTSGNLMIAADFTRLEPFKEGRARFIEKGKWGFLDLQGKVIVEPLYSRCLDYQNEVAVVYHGYRRSGLVDYNGAFIIEPEVDRILGFSEGKGLVRDKRYRYLFITPRNQLYAGFYQDARPFSHGVAAVKKQDMWGIINQKGIEVIPPKFERIFEFENGYAKVRIKQFSGIANLDGEVIVEPEYDYITYTGDGLIRVEKGNRMGYLTLGGDWVWDIEP